MYLHKNMLVLAIWLNYLNIILKNFCIKIEDFFFGNLRIPYNIYIVIISAIGISNLIIYSSPKILSI